eukprot:TRINITY_DN13489_c0_g1_i1.p1 TRINITY_DN13489_c0_g1~~TRINITY_DN13489_c0_g1_i1.p1  ORF type:complete len:120 (+),score=22.18 TRINITY_DN13489_c0_g1_i1:177-536(+)
MCIRDRGYRVYTLDGGDDERDGWGNSHNPSPLGSCCGLQLSQLLQPWREEGLFSRTVVVCNCHSCYSLGERRGCSAALLWFAIVTVVTALELSLIHISEPTRLLSISYAVFCLKKKKKK